jgi:hypothetical protein
MVNNLHVGKNTLWVCTEFTGISLSIAGLFLPWGVFAWPPNVMGFGKGYALGFEVLVGSFALTGCLTVAISIIRNIRKKELPRKGVFVGEAIIAFFSLLWIVDSRNLSWVWGWSGGPFSLSTFLPGYFLPTYGAFISCTGALITLTVMLIRQFVILDTK